MARHYSRITTYVAREFLFSFFVAFLFFFFIFFINQILLLAEQILTRRVPPLDVARLIFYSLPSIVALSFPFGALVGALMTIGRFSSDNEIIAFQASGVPYRRLFGPLLILGVVLSLGSFVMNDYFLPLGTINFGRLYRELLFSNPELELESFTVKNYEQSTIITGEVEGRRINDLVILDTTEEGEQRVIAASEAQLTEPGGQAGIVSLMLSDVFTHSTVPDRRGDFSYSEADTMEYNILLEEITFSLRNPGPRETASYDVWQVIQERRSSLEDRIAEQERLVDSLVQTVATEYYEGITAVRDGETTLQRLTSDLNGTLRRANDEARRIISDRTLSNYELEFHKKFSIPFACLTFILFAFPVGLLTRRAGRAVGFGIGLLVSTLYWSMLIAGQTVGVNNPAISPATAMWFPNAIILALGVGAYAWKARR
ncbi:MAG: LptF/LptG family permease [Spirochaetota bacterium]